MIKKMVSAIICGALVFACAANALAFDVPEYRFEGASNDELYDASGVVTANSGVQVILPDDTTEKVLPYGVEIIGPSYAGSSGGEYSQGGYIIGADGYPEVWIGQTETSPSYSSGEFFVAYTPTVDVTQATLTQKDGSLGSISISALGISPKLFENDMSKGVGHIPGTAFWNGNVCVMGHNRGTNNYFAKLSSLNVGDTITYTTNQGTRTYVVTFNSTISETDWTMLGATPDNRLTLISCVINQPSIRQCVQAVEI